jgi:hypothetical protein
MILSGEFGETNNQEWNPPNNMPDHNGNDLQCNRNEERNIHFTFATKPYDNDTTT